MIDFTAPNWFDIGADMEKQRAQTLENQLNQQRLEQNKAYMEAVKQIQSLDAPTADTMGDQLIKAGALGEGLKLKEYASSIANEKQDNARQIMIAAAQLAQVDPNAAATLLNQVPEFSGMTLNPKSKLHFSGALVYDDRGNLVRDNRRQPGTADGEKGWTKDKMRDPKTGKVVAVRVNSRTGQVEPINTGGLEAIDPNELVLPNRPAGQAAPDQGAPSPGMKKQVNQKTGEVRWVPR